MIVNFLFLLKLWLSFCKCLEAIIASTFFTSFRWLVSPILKLVSAFPTYCLLHKMHPIKYITTLWNTLYIYLVCWLVKVVVFCTCLQQSDLKFVRHGKHLAGNHLLTTYFKKNLKNQHEMHKAARHFNITKIQMKGRKY